MFFKIIIYILLVIGAIITLYPFLFMVGSSFKSVDQIFSLPPNIIPNKLVFTGYIQLFFEDFRFTKWYLNSVFVTLVRIIISLFLCSIAGFAFAKYRFRYQKLLFVFIIASIMIPFEALFVPLYIIMINFGWINSYKALIVPWAANAFGIFLMRQFMISIPNEIIDSAKVDGASGFRIYWQIAVPLSKPAFGALGIVLFLSTWTSFSWPLIVLHNPDKFTLPLGLATFASNFETGDFWVAMMSGSVLVSIPIILIFIIFQKQFVHGLTLGSVKG